MTGSLTIGMVQMAVAEDARRNLAKAEEGIEACARDGADVVCLPELFGVRYFPSTRGAKAAPEPVPGPTSRALAGAAKKNKVVVVGGSIFEGRGRSKYNTCVVFDGRGRALSTYRKVHIPQDDHYFEQDYFSPGAGYSVAKTDRGNFGTLICFDQWYPEAARVNRLMGADVLFYPTAIGRVRGIEETEGDWRSAWEAVQVGHAIANSVVVCAVNRVGTEGDTTFWGGSFVCDQFGKVLFRAGEEQGNYTVKCDLGLGKAVEDGWGFMRNRRPATYGRVAKQRR